MSHFERGMFARGRWHNLIKNVNAFSGNVVAQKECDGKSRRRLVAKDVIVEPNVTAGDL